jgi:hypothetical protein
MQQQEHPTSETQVEGWDLLFCWSFSGRIVLAVGCTCAICNKLPTWFVNKIFIGSPYKISW